MSASQHRHPQRDVNPRPNLRTVQLDERPEPEQPLQQEPHPMNWRAIIYLAAILALFIVSYYAVPAVGVR